jgi:hypothetical protein
MRPLKFFLTLAALLSCSVFATAQNLTGLTKKQIQIVMNQKYSRFKMSTMAKNDQVNSVTYVDSKKDQTFIFYFDSRDICEYHKLVEDVENLEERVSEFNKSFTKKSDLVWTEKRNGKDCPVRIEKDEYYFTIIVGK